MAVAVVEHGVAAVELEDTAAPAAPVDAAWLETVTLGEIGLLPEPTASQVDIVVAAPSLPIGTRWCTEVQRLLLHIGPLKRPTDKVVSSASAELVTHDTFGVAEMSVEACATTVQCAAQTDSAVEPDAEADPAVESGASIASAVESGAEADPAVESGAEADSAVESGAAVIPYFVVASFVVKFVALVVTCLIVVVQVLASAVQLALHMAVAGIPVLLAVVAGLIVTIVSSVAES